jgi:hypothetical protein
MTENIPVITVTCTRDLPMLHLQAQSINRYLDRSTPLYIVVNEENPQEWDTVFNKEIKHYYQHHNLTILYRTDFAGAWNSWIASDKNPWACGWEIQQVLKLTISEKLDCQRYLVLDSQNFLIQDWSPTQYGLINGKIPVRVSDVSMPDDIYNDYVKTLNLGKTTHIIGKMSICTPIFLNTSLVKHLITSNGGEEQFASWFKNASRIKSEFILYELWAEKHGGSYLYHYAMPSIEDWGNPYLRDCKSDNEFNEFLNFVGIHKSHAWVSINHRAWGNMTDSQYQQLTDKLQVYKLTPNFIKYRNTYVDIKI